MHIQNCQNLARANLIDDGLNEKEALLAVEPPSDDDNDESAPLMDSYEIANDFKLRKCSVRLKRSTFLESAFKRGYTVFQLRRNQKNTLKLKPIGIP